LSEATKEAKEPGKLLVVASGVAITNGGPGYVRKKTNPPIYSPVAERITSLLSHQDKPDRASY
jgi:hypothetical protein